MVAGGGVERGAGTAVPGGGAATWGASDAGPPFVAVVPGAGCVPPAGAAPSAGLGSTVSSGGSAEVASARRDPDQVGDRPSPRPAASRSEVSRSEVSRSASAPGRRAPTAATGLADAGRKCASSAGGDPSCLARSDLAPSPVAQAPSPSASATTAAPAARGRRVRPPRRSDAASRPWLAVEPVVARSCLVQVIVTPRNVLPSPARGSPRLVTFAGEGDRTNLNAVSSRWNGVRTPVLGRGLLQLYPYRSS